MPKMKHPTRYRWSPTRLEAARTAAGLSIYAIERDLGVRATYNWWKKGRCPDGARLMDLATLLGVDPLSLFDDTGA